MHVCWSCIKGDNQDLVHLRGVKWFRDNGGGYTKCISHHPIRSEHFYIICGPEFGSENVGRKDIVTRALYGT